MSPPLPPVACSSLQPAHSSCGWAVKALCGRLGYSAGPLRPQGTELEGQVQDVVMACDTAAQRCSLAFAFSGEPLRPVSCTATGCDFTAGERGKGWSGTWAARLRPAGSAVQGAQ